MVKKHKRGNALIKRKGLVLMLRKSGIKRVNKQVVCIIENYLIKELNKLIEILKEEMTIRGRKTLKKEDIQKLGVRKDEGWEI